MFEIYKNQRAPSLADIIKIGGAAQNLTGAAVAFSMRAEGVAALAIDHVAPAIVNPPGVDGSVRYDWAAIDTTTPGDYLGWWTVTLPGAQPQDTLEFAIRILDHAPGATSDLCTLADVRLAMETTASDTSLDDRIRDLIPVASREIITEAVREFAPVTVAATRRIEVGGHHVDLAPFDLRAATLVQLDPDGSPVTLQPHVDYELLPIGADKDGLYTRIRISEFVSLFTAKMYAFGRADLAITGDWGFATVPKPIKEAAIIAVRSWLRRDLKTYAEVDAGMPVQPYGTYKLPSASLDKIENYARYGKGLFF